MNSSVYTYTYTPYDYDDNHNAMDALRLSQIQLLLLQGKTLKKDPEVFLPVIMQLSWVNHNRVEAILVVSRIQKLWNCE